MSAGHFLQQRCGWCLSIFLSASVFGGFECDARPPDSAPYAKRIQFLNKNEITQIRLHLSHPLRISVFSLPSPYRLILDLPTVDFAAIQGASPGEHTLIQAFRAGLIAPNQSRLVLDMHKPFKLMDVRAKEDAGDSIIILDIAAIKAISFRPQGVPPRLPRSAALQGLKSSSAEKGNTRFVIIVDPGHGGTDPGAIGKSRLMEKDIVLSVAVRLARVLAAKQHYKVVLTRDEDVFVSLDDRVALARSHEADLFISLHADAVAIASNAGKIQGASIYTLSRIASDDRAEALAEKENASDVLAGLPIAPSSARGRIEAILFDLMRRETADFSFRLREHLLRRLRHSIRMSRSPRRSANFRVLRQPETPSVLIELGYMSNTQDVRELIKPRWQERAAKAIALAVDAYFGEIRR